MGLGVSLVLSKQGHKRIMVPLFDASAATAGRVLQEHLANFQRGDEGWRILPRPLRLQPPSGPAYPLKKLGKGAFATAYIVDALPLVLAEVRDIGGSQMDYSKTILAEILRTDYTSPHLPHISYVGVTLNATLFAMPRYTVPLRAAHKIAWAQAKTLRVCLAEANNRSHKLHGYASREMTLQCAAEAPLPRSLLEALTTLSDAADNYGSQYRFEFPARNLGVDAEGNLVLLDVLYDPDALKAARKQWAQRLRR